MPSSCDKTGFPVVKVSGLDVEIQLLPATKVQFEAFLAEPNGFGDTWYQEVLAVNPRVSCRKATDENVEQLFLTGVLPGEAETFGQWLGPGWGLPSVELWRSICETMTEMPCRPYLEQLQQGSLAPAAITLLQRLIPMVRPENMAQLSMMTGGVLEWVRDGQAYGGLGSPRLSFAELFCDPLKGDPIRSLRPDMRVRSFGFRLARSLKPPAPAPRRN